MINIPSLGLTFAILWSALSIAQDCPPPPRSGPFLSYVAEPDFSGRTPALQVDLTFRLPGVHNVTLHLPSVWQGQGELYKAIQDIQALSEQTVVGDGREPVQRELRFPSGQLVHIRYRVNPDREGGISSETYFRAILQR